VQQSKGRDRINSAHPSARIGNSPDFWLNIQRRSDLWEAMQSPRERERIKRARPLERRLERVYPSALIGNNALALPLAIWTAIFGGS